MHPKSSSRFLQKSCGAPNPKSDAYVRKRITFSPTLFYDFANRVGSQNKSIVDFLFRSKDYFILLTNRHVSSKLVQAKKLRLNNLIRFNEIRLFYFVNNSCFNFSESDSQQKTVGVKSKTLFVQISEINYL